MAAVHKMKVKNKTLRIPKKVVECKLRYTQYGSEDLFDIIEKFGKWIQFEPNSLMKDLPHIGAAMDLWELITVVYDSATTEAVINQIEAGELAVAEWNDFIVKYNLREKGWKLFKTEEVNGVRLITVI